MRLIDADALVSSIYARENNMRPVDDVINEAPTIRPAAGELIPLSEGLPERVEGKRYLFLDKWGGVDLIYPSSFVMWKKPDMMGLGKAGCDLLAEYTHYAEINTEVE